MKLEYPPELREKFVEWGRQGGEKIKRERGMEYYKEMARNRLLKNKAKNGPESDENASEG